MSSFKHDFTTALYLRFYEQRQLFMGEKYQRKNSKNKRLQNDFLKKENLASKKFTRKKSYQVKNILINSVIILGVSYLLIFFTPKIFSRLFIEKQLKQEVVAVELIKQEEAELAKKKAQIQDNLTQSIDQNQKESEEKKYLPPINESLTKEPWLKISKIGVDGPIHITSESEEALKNGFWMPDNFGKPGSEHLPVIIAGHRFGWKWWWQSDYGRKNSFYYLTDLEIGDQISIIYEQREWIYEVYSSEEGTKISDYDADVILFTCKYLNSDLRYLKYLKLVEK